MKSYHAIRQWNHWTQAFLGVELLEIEKRLLSKLLLQSYSKHAVLIGVPGQNSLLQNSSTSSQLLITPLRSKKDNNIQFIEGDWNELPFYSGSVDLVILPHSLEHIDNPHQALAEACRIVKPEGSIIIFGFNPYSLWGMQALLEKKKGSDNIAGGGNFLSANLLKKWLTLADFELVKHRSLLFRPPIANPKTFQNLRVIEWIGEKFFLPLGGVYMLMAKAKVIPLTPIRLHWKQQLAGMSVTLAGPTIRVINEKN